MNITICRKIEKKNDMTHEDDITDIFIHRFFDLNVINLYSRISLTLLASRGAASPIPAQAEQATTFIQFLYQASWGRCVSDGGTVCTSVRFSGWWTVRAILKPSFSCSKSTHCCFEVYKCTCISLFKCFLLWQHLDCGDVPVSIPKQWDGTALKYSGEPREKEQRQVWSEKHWEIKNTFFLKSLKSMFLWVDIQSYLLAPLRVRVSIWSWWYLIFLFLILQF